jgi:hypothetical protein
MHSDPQRRLRSSRRQAAFASTTLLALTLRGVHQIPRLHPLEQLVRDMSAIDKFARGVRYPSYRYLLAMGALGGPRLPRDIGKRLDRVWTFFGKVRITIAPSQPGERGWLGRYYLPGLRSKTENLFVNPRFLGLIIWNAAVAGELAALRECLQCHLWFAARKEDHKFCCSRCREQSFRTTDRGRASRAEYMRNYRAEIKKRDLANLRSLKPKR